MIKSFRYSVVAGLSVLLLLFSGCSKGEDSPSISVETTLSVGGQSVSQKAISQAGESFFLRITSSTDWTLEISPASAREWVHLDRTSGAATSAYDVTVKVDRLTAPESRSATLILKSGDHRQELKITQGNAVLRPDAERIELPRLSGRAQDLFVVHRTKDGTINYSLEYDTERYHPRWVAFVFDQQTAASVHKGRSEAWAWDPKVPSEYSTDNLFSGSGFSRGHMVASNDRQYSLEANKQTYYYTNMSPQRKAHNEGVWLRLEQTVQTWGRNPSFRDVLYVAKGGTIADGQIEDRRVRNKIVVPKYYYMALVVKKPNGEYHGIAFWTEHRDYANKALRPLAITIDKLEELTGIDFFHNLDDEIENRVEAEEPANNWPGV